jgi:hypothetical protein
MFKDCPTCRHYVPTNCDEVPCKICQLPTCSKCRRNHILRCTTCKQLTCKTNTIRNCSYCNELGHITKYQINITCSLCTNKKTVKICCQCDKYITEKMKTTKELLIAKFSHPAKIVFQYIGNLDDSVYHICRDCYKSDGTIIHKNDAAATKCVIL